MLAAQMFNYISKIIVSPLSSFSPRANRTMARYIYVIALDYISRTNNNLANLLLCISCSFIFEPVEKDRYTKALALNLLWFELE